MKTTTPNQYRQGDVLLVRTPETQRPAQLKPVPAVNGRIILAYGEATGHHHSIDAANSQEFVDEAGVTWLECRQAVDLLHQEHAPIALRKGLYRKVQQREYTPEAIRSVAD